MRSFFGQKNPPPSANAEDLEDFEKETKKIWDQRESNPAPKFYCPLLYPVLYPTFYSKVSLKSVYKINQKYFFELEKKV